jgi:hypothetical protein
MVQDTIKISELPIGSKIKFGRLKENGETPIEWIIVSKDHSTKDTGYPQNAVTLATSNIIKFMAFDGKEPLNALQTRKENGNNRYRQSNIRHWLNSDLGANSWFLEDNIAGQYHYSDRDAAPSQENIEYEAGHFPYDNLQGFLSMFRDYEKSLILETKVKTITNPEYDYQPSYDNGGIGNYDVTTDRFFLLSSSEIGLGANEGIEEGFVLDYFNSNTCKTQASEQAYDNSPYSTSNGYFAGYRLDSYYPYALRSPRLFNVGLVGIVSPDGNLSESRACTYLGLRVGTNLSNTTLVSAIPNENGVYEVLTDLKPVVEVKKTEFLTIDLKLQDSLARVNVVKISLNNSLISTYSSGLNDIFSIPLPYNQLIVGNNDLKIECLNNTTSLNIQNFNILLESNQLVNTNDVLATSHGLYKIINSIDNLDGSNTVQLEKNLVAGIYKNDSVEKMLFNYQPSIFVTDNKQVNPSYQNMTLSNIEYDEDKSFATEEWSLEANGTICFTKVNMQRSSIHEDVSISKVKQIFNYKNDTL